MTGTIDTLERMAPPHLWRRITGVARFVNELPDGTVVVGTARRAICLLDALATLGMVRPDRQLYASRVLDIEPNLFDRQDVLLVEDLVTSTRTLRDTMAKLRSASARSLHALAFAINTDYPGSADLAFQDAANTLLLAGDQASEFAEGILDLISASGRTYNVDWPILNFGGNPDDFLEAALRLPGWSNVESTSTTQRATRTRAFTFYPNHIECANPLANHIALTKVRALLTQQGTRRTLRLIPIVALRRLPTNWEKLVRFTQPSLPEGRWAGQAYSQHLFSLDLGGIFIEQVNAWLDRPLTFRESSRTLSLAYGSKLPTVLRMSHKQAGARSYIGQSCPLLNKRQHVLIEARAADPVLASEAEVILSGRFFEYYQESGEKVLRDAAQNGDASAVTRLIDTKHLLDTGLSIDDLERVLLNTGLAFEESRSGVSAFLDRAIDNGLVVPVISADGRRFRPGEAAMFSDRARRQCEVMLLRMQSEADARLLPDHRTKTEPGSRREHTPGRGEEGESHATAGTASHPEGRATLSQFLVQKALVALWKYGTRYGLLDKNGAGDLVSVQYYTHGAMLDLGDVPKVISTGNSIVTRVLETNQVLTPVKGRGYRVEDVGAFQGLPEAIESKVRNLGAQTVKLSQRTDRRYADEEEFILWVSTADPGQAPLALGADVALSRVDLQAACTFLRGRLAAAHPVQPRLVSVLKRQDWHAALTAGWRKSLWLLGRETERFEGAKRAGASNDYEASFLEEVIEAIHGLPAPLGSMDLRNQAIDWLLSARLCFLWLCALTESSAASKDLERHIPTAEEAIAGVAISHPLTAAVIEALAVRGSVAEDLVLLDGLLQKVERLGLQISTWTQAATGLDGRVDSYTTYASAALLVARPNLTVRSFVLDLNAFAKSTRRNPEALLEDFSDSLDLSPVMGICAEGRFASQTVLEAAAWLLANRSSHYQHAFVFSSLRAHQTIARSATTSRILCDSFRGAARELLANPLPGVLEIIAPPATLPTSIQTTSPSGSERPTRWLFFEAATVKHEDQERRGFLLAPPQTAPTRSVKVDADRLQADVLLFAPMTVERNALMSVFGLTASDLTFVENRFGRPIYAMPLTSRGGKTLKAVLAVPGGKGPAHARDAIARSLDVIDPSYIAICGIGGGIGDDMGFGDVVVGSGIVPYEYIKETPAGVKVSVEDMLPLAQLAESMYAALEIQPVSIFREDASDAVISYAAIGSGNAVLRDELGTIRQYLTSHTSRPMVAEMEAAAVVRELRSLGPSMLGRAFVVRGVSDLADRDKDDSYHQLAAENAAITLKSMLDLFPRRQ